MTTSKDTQEMLSEYGAIKLAENELLDDYIKSAERKKETYKSDLERINDFGFEKAMKMTLLSNTKKTLENNNVPVTEQTVLAHIKTYIKGVEEDLKNAIEERR